MPVYKLCTRCETLKEVTEFGKNSSRADGLFIYCKLCVSARYFANANKVLAYQKEYASKNAEKISIRQKKWRINNSDKLQQDAKEYYSKNSERIKHKAREWVENNPDRRREGNARRRIENIERYRKYAREWVKRNPGKANEALARRRVAQFNATPKWIDRKAVRKIYVDAARLTRETGIPHAVDHIVPLRSKIVCGLHWEGNLQIITKSENSMKSNRRWPDMP